MYRPVLISDLFKLWPHPIPFVLWLISIALHKGVSLISFYHYLFILFFKILISTHADRLYEIVSTWHSGYDEWVCPSSLREWVYVCNRSDKKKKKKGGILKPPNDTQKEEPTHTTRRGLLLFFHANRRGSSLPVSEGLSFFVGVSLSPSPWSHLQMPLQWCHSVLDGACVCVSAAAEEQAKGQNKKKKKSISFRPIEIDERSSPVARKQFFKNSCTFHCLVNRHTRRRRRKTITWLDFHRVFLCYRKHDVINRETRHERFANATFDCLLFLMKLNLKPKKEGTIDYHSTAPPPPKDPFYLMKLDKRRGGGPTVVYTKQEKPK